MSTIERPLPPLNADERTTLESWLDFHRATLAMKCEDALATWRAEIGWAREHCADHGLADTGRRYGPGTYRRHYRRIALPLKGLEGRVAMLESSHIVAFAAATDLHRARAFYEQVLGLTVAEHNDIACVLDANGTMLRVTAVPDVCRAGYTVLGWRVTDITAAVRGLADRGVVFLRYDGMTQDSDGVWTAPGGDKVAWFTDPDGNVLSLTQSL